MAAAVGIWLALPGEVPAIAGLTGRSPGFLTQCR
jgi:hypothetical protein